MWQRAKSKQVKALLRVLRVGVSGVTLITILAGCAKPPEGAVLLNVSYDVSRDIYKDYNPWFVARQSVPVTINQSHGGASSQSQAVANGLAADVVTMNQPPDITQLVDKGLVSPDWQTQLPNNAVPYVSTIVLVVRAGNPEGVTGWADLTRVSVVMANPKTSGTGRYGVLGAYAYAKQTAQPDTFMPVFLSNIVVFDNGARAASNSFIQRNLGDVLVTTENEAHALKKVQPDIELVYPNQSVRIDNPVAVVTSTTKTKGTTALATAYLASMWETEAQVLFAKHHLRPVDEAVLAAHTDQFVDIELVDPVTVFGDWTKIMAIFADSGQYDRWVADGRAAP